MRLKILIFSEREQAIPINYQYPLMSSILSLLRSASTTYADFIHHRGYPDVAGKNRKLFTFSKLSFFPPPIMHSNKLLLNSSTTGYFFVASPMIDDFLTKLIIGASKRQLLKISDASFAISDIELIQTPEFAKKMRFKTLSPIVVTTVKEYKGKLSTYYYRPLDQGLEDAIKKSLLGKYGAIHKTSPRSEEIRFQIDKDYITRRGGETKVSKLIHIKENRPNEWTKIKAFECPFYLEGCQELMQVAWDCGIGDKTSMGFGCIGLK